MDNDHFEGAGDYHGWWDRLHQSEVVNFSMNEGNVLVFEVCVEERVLEFH